MVDALKCLLDVRGNVLYANNEINTFLFAFSGFRSVPYGLKLQFSSFHNMASHSQRYSFRNEAYILLITQVPDA